MNITMDQRSEQVQQAADNVDHIYCSYCLPANTAFCGKDVSDDVECPNGHDCTEHPECPICRMLDDHHICPDLDVL